ncbi:hypothetical protein U8C35_06550 [Sinorhizobium medicae]|uniref:hypothetical protein n=1 Tax=Sinorhizobium medicae TaxID=110321 RepID=UPI002AF6AEE5|nr:hypothetical protein [Sinorhizobium medicae]WQO60093.1 hypothetical protein U8C35_06550 [Sinorhizobium medicae]
MSDRQSVLDAELLNLVRGQLIGHGTYRKVYLYLPDTSLVIKEEATDYKFDNVTEWEVWRELQNTKYADWLARTLTISPNGTVIMQERTSPVPEAMLPKMIPSIFADTKAENWGMVVRNGKKLIVCHDYAHSRLINVPKKIRLVPAKWHDPSYKGWAK